MVIALVAFFIPFSIILTELNFWQLFHVHRIGTLTEVLTPAVELLIIYQCVRLYLKLNNPFFKFMAIALSISVGNDALRLLRSHFFSGRDLYQHNDVLVALDMLGVALVTVIPLLALYTLLVYKESGEQTETVSPLKKFYLLIPSAKDSKRFWLLVIGIPLAVNIFMSILPLVKFKESIDLVWAGAALQIFSSINLSTHLIGLFLSLGLARVYGNNLFKYILATYIIHLGVAALSLLFNVPLFMFWEIGLPPVISVFQQLQGYIALASHIAVPALLVYAIFTYRESHVNILKPI